MCCFCDFFFFKQKTAYEMRISDWSSDVCSSDLPRTIAEQYACLPSLQTFNQRLGDIAMADDPDGLALEHSRAGRSRANLVAAEALLCLAEIGRASCRERVCQ